MDKFTAKFIEEATDNIKDLEDALLILENEPNNRELVERVFRAMHTIKGGGAMFGFQQLSDFTHHLENVYDLVREDKLSVTRDLLDITLQSVDHMKVLLSNEDSNSPAITAQHNDLIVKIKKIEENRGEDIGISGPKEKSTESRLKTYYIYFAPDPDIFNDGTNPLFLLDELHSLGDCKVFSHLNKIPAIDTLDVTKCYTYWEILLATENHLNDINDVFIFVEDQCELEINEVADFNILTHETIVQELAKIAASKDDIGLSEIQRLIKDKKGDSSSDLSEIEKKIKKTGPLPSVKENAISSIRVSSGKLDRMMNLVSELVTTQARLSLYAEQTGDSELMTIAENVQKLSRQLRDNAFDIVLVPIETMLTRFQRLVRDLSKDQNKDIAFSAEGVDTELDKTIIESLTDPLLHILRNSIDHGIESAEQRKKLKKPAQGKILLKAFYSGANVIIQISDDGAGIDPAKIRAKAIEKGLISKDAVLSKKEILDLTFRSGFSTAQNITDVSGRGVGMDVVKRKLAEIRGEVEIDSEINVGTTLTIKLPLTLSIIDGLLVKIAENHYIIPLNAVDKIYATEHQKVVNTFNNMIILDGKQIPFYYLREEFDFPEGTQSIEQVIVVSYSDQKIGLVVDDVVGEYQAVLKSLGKLYKQQEIISGATILGDGTVALVMDPNKIIAQFSKEITEEKKQKN
ncbi:MAG: chemotaxis protein CheA [Bacteroidales bacterium]|jgi:two-component system chemotaxis sensor kinase CheA|nr:chemotaxis protein CheA [Bacteroidales bacterium]